MSSGHPTRRTMLVGGGCAVVTWLGSSCADDSGTADTDGGSSDGSSSGSTGATTSSSSGTTASTQTSTTTTTTEGTTTDASASSSTTDEGSTGTPSECMQDQWLAGGTASMAGDYPAPFDDAPQTCELFTPQTCGPCYAAGADRKDITEGLVGLPMRLNLRVVYETTCEPVPDCVVDVWFTNVDGEYSDDTPSNICNNGNPAVIQESFMRGQQTTDAGGLVEFDAVFPGWYPGRTTHIHVLFIVGNTAHYVTQLYFEDDLTEGIYMTHPDYSHRPNRTTDNAADGPFDPSSPNLMSTRRTYDCALQAWATVAIPATPAGVNC